MHSISWIFICFEFVHQVTNILSFNAKIKFRSTFGTFPTHIYVFNDWNYWFWNLAWVFILSIAIKLAYNSDIDLSCFVYANPKRTIWTNSRNTKSSRNTQKSWLSKRKWPICEEDCHNRNWLRWVFLTKLKIIKSRPLSQYKFLWQLWVLC